jgi:hypothetical protein
MDVVEEGRGRTRGELSVAEPDLETLMRYGIMNRGGMRVLHPKDLRKIIHLDIFLRPEIKRGSGIVILMTVDMASCPCQGACGDHRSEGTE